MEIKIEGNPGTGNSFTEVNIQHVENYNPAATTVINNYGTREEKQGVKDKLGNPKSKKCLNEMRENPPIREQIMLYVSCLNGQVVDEWKSRYMKLWKDLLELEIVAASVYNPGKQQGTNFNRNLVANIIHYLNGKGIYFDYNAAQFAEKLEGDKDHSVRGALGNDPSPEIVSRLNRYFE